MGVEVTPLGMDTAFMFLTPPHPTASLLEHLDAARLPGKPGKGTVQKRPPP